MTREGKFLFLQGDANGGKTTFIETLKSIFGDADRGYGGGVNGENLTSLRGDHKEWLARIDGMRMVIVSDIPNGSWNLGSLKATVTGDTITARFMNKESFEFRPVAKIIVSGNNKPRIPQSDSGFNRRLVLIPVDEIPEGERDKTFQRKLHMELPQIAHWMVDAAVEYFGKGLNESVPDRWSQASSSYQRDEDVIRQWFDSSCVIDEKAFTTSDSLVRSYNEFTGSKLQRITPIAEWLNQNCKHAYPGQADFNDPQNNRRRQKRGFYGIQLRPSSI